MDDGLIFPYRLVRLNLYVCPSKMDPPDRCGGWGRRKPATRGRFVVEVRSARDREERRGDDPVARTKTDTGRRGEYPQALERTAVKELGNLTP